MTRLLYISVCLRTRQDTISYSFIYIVQKLETGDRGTPKLGTGTVELRKLWYSETMDRDRGTPKLWNSETVDRDRGTPETVACYSHLLVLVCWSVSQDPPGRLKTLLLRRPFYTLRRQRSANQRSRMCTWYMADQSAIASPTVQRATSDQPFAILSRDLA